MVAARDADGGMTDVLVVGAGPTGLTLAAQLSALGTRVPADLGAPAAAPAKADTYARGWSPAQLDRGVSAVYLIRPDRYVGFCSPGIGIDGVAHYLDGLSAGSTAGDS